MPFRKEEFGEGGYYHVFNRGVNRQRIFVNSENYRYFLRLLKSHTNKNHIELVCYCLMPNHYHLLLYQKSDKSISIFMHGMMSAYSQAFNKQRGRTGTLFEGRFKYVRVEKQEYLLNLITYLHLNPVKAQLVVNPEDWEYSDYYLWTTYLPESCNGKIHSGTFGKMKSWHVDRIKYFRQELGLPEPSEYKEYITEHQITFEQDIEFQKYLLDRE